MSRTIAAAAAVPAAAASVLPMGGGGLGIGTVVVLSLIGWAFGIDPSILIGGAEMVSRGGSQYQQQTRPTHRRTGAPTDQTGQFVAAVLGNTEDTWTEIFQQQRPAIPRAEAAAVRGGEQGGCGFAQAAMGPFYCPTDRRIYLDTSFFREIETRFHGCSGKACKFSQAYVIAHEVGHHVQNLLGTLPKAQAAQQAAGIKAGANRIQVRVELQADCYRRRLGKSFRAAQTIPRARRRRCGVADRQRDRRRHAAEAVAGARGAGRLYPRLGRAAQALVHDRLHARQDCRPAIRSRRRSL